MDLLGDPTIVAAISRAWQDSKPDDLQARHEEGGYIVLNADLNYAVERWPHGERSRIVPPPLDADNRYNGSMVVAAFHTHPNPPIDEMGREWKQDPSESDRRWYARRKLKGFVISRMFVYEIDMNADVRVVGKHDEVRSL